jgi:hypothetical protein
MLEPVVFMAAGVAVGVFCPAICREIKSWFVKEATVLDTESKAAIAALTAKAHTAINTAVATL